MESTPLAAADGANIGPPFQPDPHRKFVDLLHELGGIFWEMDAQTWRFTFVSERVERIFGYPVRRWYDEERFWQDVLIHPDDREWCVHFCTVASGECRNHAFLYRASTADGRDVWIKDVVRVIPDEAGNPKVMRGVMVDATDEVQGKLTGRKFELDYDAPELAEFRRLLAA